MKPNRHNKPLIPQGWLRVLVFIFIYFSLLVLAGSVLGHFQPRAASPKNDTALQGAGYLLFIVDAIVSLAVVWLFLKYIDRRAFDSIGFSIDKQGMHAGAGFFLGIFLLCSGSCILYVSKNLVWTDIHFNGNDLFLSFGLMVIVAFYEEIVFRGYILNNLLESSNRWLALLLSALLFALAHMTNPDFSVLGAVNIFLAGILLGLNYSYTRNLWFGIMLHFTWNFFQGPLLGYQVSGMALDSLLQHDINGSTLVTGGPFGFEGSLVATLLCVLAIVGLAWVYERKYSSQPVFDHSVATGI